MIIVKTAYELNKIILKKRSAAAVAGFVPTMGALHQGHTSLLAYSKKQCDFSVCSIFVNPVQFNNKEDFDNYPVTIDEDAHLLENNGCDILFLPSVEEVYPGKEKGYTTYDLGYLDTVLEGEYRPGHFQGVCNAVHRLLSIAEPDILYLGQKDYQQCMVIKKMIEQVNLSRPVRVEVCTTVREPNGLAMSSRNFRLSESEKIKAGVIYRSLQVMKNELRPGNIVVLKSKAREILAENGLKTDYAEIAEADTLRMIDSWDGSKKLVALTAAWVNDVRLIDNMLLN